MTESNYFQDKARVASFLLIFATVASWFMFPLMVKQLGPQFFHTALALCLLLSVGIVISTLTWRLPILPMLQKLMLASWGGYLLALLLATLESASIYSLFQWCVLFAKFLFFLFLLLYIDMRYIVTTLRIYANLMVLTVFFAIFAMILLAIGVEPLAKVDVGGKVGDVYWGAYYVRNYNDLICWSFFEGDVGRNILFRIQGLSEEPGTYAFALLPAFFWFLIAERAYWRSAVILLGLMFSFSLGVGIWLLVLLPLMMRRSLTGIVPIFIFGAVCAIGLLSVVSSDCISKNRNHSITGEFPSLIDSRFIGLVETVGQRAILSSPVELIQIGSGLVVHECFGGVEKSSYSGCDDAAKRNLEYCNRRIVKEAGIEVDEKKASIDLPDGVKLKISSFQDRVNGLQAVREYFRNHLIGTGAALGMLTVNNSISVGYATAVLEAGIIGGGFYLCLFAIMGYLSLKTIAILNHDTFHNRVTIVVSLSVATVLVMGLQRMQPDLSFWHMWIYAMWFYLTQVKHATLIQNVKPSILDGV